MLWSKGPTHGAMDVGRETFDAAVAGTLGNKKILYRHCPSCANSHVHMFYVRLTPIPIDVSMYDLFTTQWYQRGNTLNVDFELYSTEEEAFGLSRENRWSFCNYVAPPFVGVGFPQ